MSLEERPKEIVKEIQAKPQPMKADHEIVSREPLMNLNSSNAPNENISRPAAALRSASVRPVSARPSAPRRRDRNVQQILPSETLTHQTDRENVKREKKNDIIAELDDSENIVIADIIDANAMNGELISNVVSETADTSIDGKQGHLVQQIIQTQNALTKIDGSSNDGKPAVFCFSPTMKSYTFFNEFSFIID